MTWNAEQYLRFGGHRVRPMLDLLSAIDIASPRRVIDLGSGPGNATMLLRSRWPGCELTGLDNDPGMLARARNDFPAERWIEGDIAHWATQTHEDGLDLVFSNAALQWLPGHETLFPRLLGAVSAGGVFACQMPHNFAAASHRLLREMMDDTRWRKRLEDFVRWEPVSDPVAYYDHLCPDSAHVDIWETEYLQVLQGPDAVLEWVKGSALVPVREELPAEEYSLFLDRYGRRLREAYPARPDGTTLFPFRRIFIVAQKK